MIYTYTYKKQGDGRDTWRCEVKDGKTLIDIYMVEYLTADNWKLKAVLNADGLLSQVETALNALPEPTKTNALFAWDNSLTVDSNSDTTKMIQSVLGLSLDDVISIFERAQNFKI